MIQRGGASLLFPFTYEIMCLVLIFLGESDLWAHVKIPWCICLGSPIFSDMWALLVSDMFQCGSFVHFNLVFNCVFPLLQMWVPADDNSPKLMEMVSCKPYIYV